jgi:mannosyltransferase OCH1-like enzyme
MPDTSSWQRLNPSFEYKLWRDWDMKYLLRNYSQWKAINTWNGKSDVARFEMLERFGGIYIDADTVALRPLTDDLLENDFFACYESETERPGLVASGIMGAIPGHLLMSLCIGAIAGMEDINSKPAWDQVGPGLLTRKLQGFHSQFKIYPSRYFLPTHYTGKQAQVDFQPYCSHSWGTTTGQYDKVTA